MLIVTNEMTCGNIEYTSGDYKFTGDFKISPITGKVNSFNVYLSNSGDSNNHMSSGNASGYLSDGSLKISVSNVDQSISDIIVNMMNNLVTELESKYAVI